MKGRPESDPRPYDPRSRRHPGSTPVRQAHRAALWLRGIRVQPGWVAGGLLAAAFISTGMTAGSTKGMIARTAHPVESSQAQLAAVAVAVEVQWAAISQAGSVGNAAVDAPARVPPAASFAQGRLGAMVEIYAGMAETSAPAAPPKATVSAPASRPTATVSAPTSRPKATPRPNAAVTQPAPRPTTTQASAAPISPPKAPVSAPATKPKATQAAAAPAPRPKATPRPKTAPAITYDHRAAGQATWGPFGGAVITRLPRGTQIRVCGRLGCWEGVSSGYGPMADGGHLVDLDAAIFRRLCGPLGTGVASIVLSWR
jgi:hypothetical protein